MKTHIHHIELSHTSPHVSGGEKALIEILRYFSVQDELIQTVYTSESGVEVYKKHLGHSADSITFVTIGSKRIERIHEYIAFYMRVFQCLFYVVKFDPSVTNIIFSHEEFLPSAIYSYLLKKRNPAAKWIAFFHMKSPSVWRGFEGEYTKKLQFPSIRILRYKFEQWIFFLLTKRNVNKVITVNSCYEEFLSTIYKNPYSLKVFGGESVHVIDRYSGVEIDKSNARRRLKKYELSFMARFHEQKGVFEVIDIMKKLKVIKPDISIVVLGGGVKRIEDEFFRRVKAEGLSENITYLGYITGDEKYDVLADSKIFLFPSYYESFGQSALEAMKCGLPVVAYDLPPFAVFTKGMIKVPILDNGKMTEEIYRLLIDQKYYSQIQKYALDFSSEFSWEKTGEEIYSIMTNI